MVKESVFRRMFGQVIFLSQSVSLSCILSLELMTHPFWTWLLILIFLLGGNLVFLEILMTGKSESFHLCFPCLMVWFSGL